MILFLSILVTLPVYVLTIHRLLLLRKRKSRSEILIEKVEALFEQLEKKQTR